MEREPETETRRVTLRLPESLYRALRAEAGNRAISMQQLAVEWLTEKATEARGSGNRVG